MDHSMRTTLVAALIAGLSLSYSASAQKPAGAALPADIDPVSLTRLPPLKRADRGADQRAERLPALQRGLEPAPHGGRDPRRDLGDRAAVRVLLARARGTAL